VAEHGVQVRERGEEPVGAVVELDGVDAGCGHASAVVDRGGEQDGHGGVGAILELDAAVDGEAVGPHLGGEGGHVAAAVTLDGEGRRVVCAAAGDEVPVGEAVDGVPEVFHAGGGAACAGGGDEDIKIDRGLDRRGRCRLGRLDGGRSGRRRGRRRG